MLKLFTYSRIHLLPTTSNKRTDNYSYLLRRMERFSNLSPELVSSNLQIQLAEQGRVRLSATARYSHMQLLVKEKMKSK